MYRWRWQTAASAGTIPNRWQSRGIDLTLEIQKLDAGGAKAGDAKYDAAMKKSEEFRKNLDQLSEEDMKIYVEEVTKLMKAAGL